MSYKILTNKDELVLRDASDKKLVEFLKTIKKELKKRQNATFYKMEIEYLNKKVESDNDE